MASLELIDLTVRFEGVAVLAGISLGVGDGEFVGIVGPSGSGKSTLLRAVAGLVPVGGGAVVIDGRDVTAAPPAQRDVSMLFQEPSMLPGRSVHGNVAFPLQIRAVSRVEADERVGAELRAHHIEELAARPADELSRGEQQLVQTARALVRQPRLLLLDEPLTAVDEPRRAQFRTELRLLQTGYGVTTLMATNDAVDAMSLPSRLLVVERGRVVQDAAPAVVFATPATLGAAIGTGPLAVLRARVEVVAGDVVVATTADDGSRLRVSGRAPGLVDRIGDEVFVGLRPTDVEAVSLDDPGAEIVAVVDRVVAVPRPSVLCRIGSQSFQAAVGWPPPRPGRRVAFRVTCVRLFDATSERAI